MRFQRLPSMLSALTLLVLPFAAGGQEDEPRELWLKGQLLVATESLGDPNFRGSVVYMVEHGAEGAMGLIVNRRLATGPLDRLLEGFGRDPAAAPAIEISLYEGGPVARGQAMMLHSDDHREERTVLLGDGLALSDPGPILDAMAEGGGPGAGLLILGHAGWAPSQLEREIASGAWYVVDGDPGLVLDQEVGTKWRRAFDRRGRDL